MAGTLFAQEPTSPPAPPPPPAPPIESTNHPHARQPLTEEQRAQLEQRLNDTWAKMPLEAKQRLMHLHRALAEMPPDERKFVHDRIERFLNMSATEREKLRQNKQRWDQMTPEERQKARDEFRKHSKEYEQQWHHDHPGEEGTATTENSGTTTTPAAPNSAPAPTP